MDMIKVTEELMKKHYRLKTQFSCHGSVYGASPELSQRCSVFNYSDFVQRLLITYRTEEQKSYFFQLKIRVELAKNSPIKFTRDRLLENLYDSGRKMNKKRIFKLIFFIKKTR